MALLFHLTGESLQPRRSTAFTTQGYFIRSPAAVPAVTPDAASLGTNIITTANATRVRSLIYTGFENWTGTNDLSILISVIPRFTGPPSFRNALMSVGIPAAGILESGMFWYSQVTTAQSVFFGYDNDGVQLVGSGNITSGAASYVSGTRLDHFMTWAGGLTTNALEFFVDAVSIGNMNSAALSSRDNNETSAMNFMFADSVVALSDLDVVEIAIWNSIESPPDPLRTTYITSTALDKTINNDPGIANVVAGTNYDILGANLTGTFNPIQLGRVTGVVGSRVLNGEVR